MKRVIYLLMACFIISGCQPKFEEYVAAFQETLTAIPTNTEIPTQTPYSTYTTVPTYTIPPTYTPYPTHTPYPTCTPHVVTVTYTPTPRFTPTDTSTPTVTPTITNTPNKTQTQQAIINATKGADATGTAVAKVTLTEKKAQYEKIDYNELLTYPDSHKGEYVWVEGRIFNIVNNKQLQMYLGWTRDAIFVKMEKTFSELYDNNWIIVYGIVDGEYCFKNAFGGSVCQPLLVDAWYEKK